MIITREIGIDMAHRVPDHASKCKNLHGHRYRIQAGVIAPNLVPDGEQRGMVLDFGFLKDIMMTEIDTPCDHGACLWVEDPIYLQILGTTDSSHAAWADHRRQALNAGHAETAWIWGKLYLLPDVPTAEVLARHWYQRLLPRVLDYVGAHDGMLHHVKVWETPNCSAEYRGNTADHATADEYMANKRRYRQV